MKKTCGECVFCVQEEYGYSCYTVLGIEWNCALNLNPSFPREDASEENVHYADVCARYKYGEPTYIRLE